MSARHVVTAGHCVTPTSPSAVTVGDSDITTDYDCLDTTGGCDLKGNPLVFSI